jgi:hypothetical protein
MTVLGIRIRMFLGLTDPDPDPSLFLYMNLADWNNSWQNRIRTQNFSKILTFNTEDDVLWVSYKKKIRIFFFILKVIKEGIGSGVGSGSIYQKYGSGDTNPYSHQNVMDP